MIKEAISSIARGDRVSVQGGTGKLELKVCWGGGGASITIVTPSSFAPKFVSLGKINVGLACVGTFVRLGRTVEATSNGSSVSKEIHDATHRKQVDVECVFFCCMSCLLLARTRLMRQRSARHTFRKVVCNTEKRRVPEKGISRRPCYYSVGVDKAKYRAILILPGHRDSLKITYHGDKIICCSEEYGGTRL